MKYANIRQGILYYLDSLQQHGFSYQQLCDYINANQKDFTLFKDFFSRFKSNQGYHKGPAKQKKLAIIQTYLSTLHQQHATDEEEITSLLKKVIQDGLNFEFKTYANINRFEDELSIQNLTKYIDKDNPVFLNIKNNLAHKKQYNWILDIKNYGSNFKILSMEVTNIFSKNAVVKTNEYWKLFWIDKNSKKLQYKFETINAQIYLLSKDDKDTWKVVDNIYKSNVTRIRPELINHSLLKKLSLKQPIKHKTALFNLLKNDDPLNCLTFLTKYHLDYLSKNQLKESQKLEEFYLYIHRMLNTDKINLATYKSELSILKQKINVILEQIFLAN